MKKLNLLLVIFCLVIFCQDTFCQVYQLMPQYGYQANRFRFDSTLQIPTVCGVPTLKSNVTKLGAIAFDSCNNRFYTYNPKTATWSQVSGGGGSTDTTSLSARINLKIDSVKRRSDSVYAYRNGTEVFQFRDSVGTNPAPVGYYGAFQDTTTQTAAAINTAYAVKLRVTDLSNQVTISNESKIKIANAGIYNIQFSLQLEKTGGSGNMITDIWLRKNGTNINGTTGKVVLTGSANASPIVAAWNYVISVSSNDSLELMWSTNNDNVVIKAAPATSPHPSIPSAILTVTQQSGIMAGSGISPLDTATMLTPYFRRSLSANDTIKTNGKVFQINAKTLTKNSSIKLDTIQVVIDAEQTNGSANLTLNGGQTSLTQIDGNYTNQMLMNTDGVNFLSTDGSSARGLVVNSTLGTYWYSTSNDTTGIFPITKGSTGKILKLQNDKQLIWANDSIGITASDTSVFQRKQLAPYSFQANGTHVAANASATYFKDTSGTYTGTIAWTGTTAPSGATNHSYRWTRIGKQVTLNVNLVYATNGGALTALVFDLPSDCPTPIEPAGLTAASQNMYPVLMWTSTSTNTLSAASQRGFLRNNSGNNGYEIVCNFTTHACNSSYVTLTYWTN
jgi:hypothetical protein